jgi:GH15 family glucan-1,4-alpha-glucosidase
MTVGPDGDAWPEPIEGYGLVGDTRTAALVSSSGALDWMCVPRFDGAPVFGRLVGGRQAGTFRMGPNGPATVVERRYRPDTATLQTTWSTPASRSGTSGPSVPLEPSREPGRLTLTEGMLAEVSGGLLPSTVLVRRLSCEDGECRAVVQLDPRLGERHRLPKVRRRGRTLVCDWGALAVSVDVDQDVELPVGGPLEVTITPDRPLTVVLTVADREPLVHLDPGTAWSLLLADEARWQDWTSGVDADLPWRDLVVRSLLTLRLLTYSPSGAPVAAPTTSLPEDLGGIRNWDYRYAWPRDASIGVGAFLGVGRPQEAHRFMRWLLHACRLERPDLPVLRTVHGRRPPPERAFDGWPGFADSAPVRVGNDAANQHQLDGYGWVLDAAWLLVQSGHDLGSETWRAMRGYADLVATRWREPDAGIWEVRGDPVHHVHSVLMAWLALDRALRISETHRIRDSRRRRWQQARDAIAAEVRERGFSSALGSYTGTYGSTDLDAAVLVLPLLGVDDDPVRLRGTVDAIADGLSAGGPLVYRYPPGSDGLPGTEGAFLPCAFWLVQALALTGRREEAERRFAELAALATPLGLYAEEIEPATGLHQGNFPQALTHAALVQAALSLRDAARAGAQPGAATTGAVRP